MKLGCESYLEYIDEITNKKNQLNNFRVNIVIIPKFNMCGSAFDKRSINMNPEQRPKSPFEKFYLKLVFRFVYRY
ncbi:hypothetical protein BpHYR1_042805 [Brachionus plicatilis]|uniref:Uncharacterized protein n=1 Tax=Brachionus plicatilis TaxID=10195 RepID=A0A3M7SQ35_BRAPC|nr:hypothetical protein BpHYR1_042805 [Brachionus plicatilis]